MTTVRYEESAGAYTGGRGWVFLGGAEGFQEETTLKPTPES